MKKILLTIALITITVFSFGQTNDRVNIIKADTTIGCTQYVGTIYIKMIDIKMSWETNETIFMYKVFNTSHARFLNYPGEMQMFTLPGYAFTWAVIQSNLQAKFAQRYQVALNKVSYQTAVDN